MQGVMKYVELSRQYRIIFYFVADRNLPKYLPIWKKGHWILLYVEKCAPFAIGGKEMDDAF